MPTNDVGSTVVAYLLNCEIKSIRSMKSEKILLKMLIAQKSKIMLMNLIYPSKFYNTST